MRDCEISIKEKLGQLIMLDFRYWRCNKTGRLLPLLEAHPDVLKLLKQYHLGSVILFSENIRNTAQTVSLLRGLQSASKLPLLFGVDQEGGIVNRLQQGTTTPGNMLLGATGNPQCAQDMAEIIGAELSALGFNLNFAPTLDINSNQNNPVIGIRAFSDDAKTVWKMGQAYIAGLQKQNIIPCVKHFPGHGDTEQDTHVGLAIVKRNKTDLLKQELYPFAQACKAQVEMVMAAHVIMPALDDTQHISKKDGKSIGIPASLSPAILIGLLRKQLGYQGLIVTDALDMLAISTHFGQSEAVIKCILAGADLAMMPVQVRGKGDEGSLAQLFDDLEKKYLDNTDFATRVNESYQRIISFKQKQGLLRNPLFTKNAMEHIALAEEIVYSKKHQLREGEVAKKGVTLLKNNGLLPYKLCAGKHILVLDSCYVRLKLANNALQKIAITNGIKFHLDIQKNNEQGELDESLKYKMSQADIILLLSENLQPSSALSSTITQFAAQKSYPLVNIACKRPYDIAYLDGVQNYMCIYGASSVDQTTGSMGKLEANLLSGLESLFVCPKSGKVFNKPTGKLPVTIRSQNSQEVLYARGSGLSYSY